MQILLSCSKDMSAHAGSAFGLESQPAFADKAVQLARSMAAYTAEELSRILKINPRLAAQNKLRYEQFVSNDGLQPAISAYTGIAYKYLNASDFDTQDMLFAREHLWMTSFLYGLLRPTDLIQNYRLEGNVVLPDVGTSLFDYWKPLLTHHLIESVQNDDGILVYLASAEMKRIFDWKLVERSLTVIRPEFMVERNGRLKSIVVYAKMCRGAMTRYLIKHRLASIDALKAFEFEGFTYAPAEQEDGTLRFILQ